MNSLKRGYSSDTDLRGVTRAEPINATTETPRQQLNLPAWLPADLKIYVSDILPYAEDEEKRNTILRVAFSEDLKELWDLLLRRGRDGKYLYPARISSIPANYTRWLNKYQAQRLTFVFYYIVGTLCGPSQEILCRRKSEFDEFALLFEERAKFLREEFLINSEREINPKLSTELRTLSVYYEDIAFRCRQIADKSCKNSRNNMRAINIAMEIACCLNQEFGKPFYRQSIKAASLAGLGDVSYEALRGAWRELQTWKPEFGDEMSLRLDISEIYYEASIIKEARREARNR